MLIELNSVHVSTNSHFSTAWTAGIRLKECIMTHVSSSWCPSTRAQPRARRACTQSTTCMRILPVRTSTWECHTRILRTGPCTHLRLRATHTSYALVPRMRVKGT